MYLVARNKNNCEILPKGKYFYSDYPLKDLNIYFIVIITKSF